MIIKHRIHIFFLFVGSYCVIVKHIALFNGLDFDYIIEQVGIMRKPYGASQRISGTLPEKEIIGARTTRVRRDEERGNGGSSRVAATCVAASQQVPRNPQQLRCYYR